MMVRLILLVASISVLTSIAILTSGTAKAQENERDIGFDVALKHAGYRFFDPIVFPGDPGPVGHLHQFSGMIPPPNASYTALRNTRTNAHRSHDHSAYWVPALIAENGKRVTPRDVKAYYRSGISNHRQVQPLPDGLRIIAGDAHSTGPQSIVQWTCKNTKTGHVAGPFAEPKQCRAKHIKPRVQVFFPSCWDGRNLDSPDHASHMAYPSAGKCPSTHPVAIPRLGLQMNYPARGERQWTNMDTVEFSSGGRYSMHADVVFAWKKGKNGIGGLTRRCVNSGKFCSIKNQPR